MSCVTLLVLSHFSIWHWVTFLRGSDLSSMFSQFCRTVLSVDPSGCSFQHKFWLICLINSKVCHFAVYFYLKSLSLQMKSPVINPFTDIYFITKILVLLWRRPAGMTGILSNSTTRRDATYLLQKSIPMLVSGGFSVALLMLQRLFAVKSTSGKVNIPTTCDFTLNGVRTA